MKTSVLAIAVFAAYGTARAADAPLYPKRTCDPLAQSAVAFHDCYAANLDAANRALNATYRSMLARKTFYVGDAAGLREVERAWVVYKERECAYEYGAHPRNDDYWLGHADCEIRITERRLRELEDRPSCTGGESVCYPHMR